MKRTLGLAAAVALVLGSIQAQAQSVIYTFSDATSDGWANAGFGGSPLASVSNIGGQNYIFLPLGGFQVGNVSAGSGALYNAMAAAAASPAVYNLSYDYYINTANWGATPGTYFQIGSFVNTGGGYYAQDFGAVKEVELNGTQVASGAVFTGHVSVNFAAVGFSMPADTFYRLGLIENGDGSGAGVGAYFTNISVAPIPEPGSLALIGLGMTSLITIRRRHS